MPYAPKVGATGIEEEEDAQVLRCIFRLFLGHHQAIHNNTNLNS
jgi:hypothetical protein